MWARVTLATRTSGVVRSIRPRAHQSYASMSSLKPKRHLRDGESEDALASGGSKNAGGSLAEWQPRRKFSSLECQARRVARRKAQGENEETNFICGQFPGWPITSRSDYCTCRALRKHSGETRILGHRKAQPAHKGSEVNVQ